MDRFTKEFERYVERCEKRTGKKLDHYISLDDNQVLHISFPDFNVYLTVDKATHKGIEIYIVEEFLGYESNPSYVEVHRQREEALKDTLFLFDAYMRQVLEADSIAPYDLAT
ncbi:hypothetical protein IQ238_28215 [Pleurocapsales cyanobacterium LEGE 06147]|nr:hypothetical protein [Pleurocapsales cyanobacterium LEGE 06147]